VGKGVGHFVVFDVETTGLAATARVVEFAAVVLDERGEEVERFDTLIDPGGPTGPSWLHGVTPEMVTGAPTFEEVAGRIEHLLRDRVHVAHNIAFDRAVLGSELRRLGVTWPLVHNGICTAALSERRLGGRSLTQACRLAGIEHPTPHRALPDVLATVELLRTLQPALDGRRLRPCPSFGGAWRLPVTGQPTSRSDRDYVAASGALGGTSGMRGTQR